MDALAGTGLGPGNAGRVVPIGFASVNCPVSWRLAVTVLLSPRNTFYSAICTHHCTSGISIKYILWCVMVMFACGTQKTHDTHQGLWEKGLRVLFSINHDCFSVVLVDTQQQYPTGTW